MKQFLRQAAVALGASASLFPGVVHAQATASSYTSATRYDAVGRVVGTIAPDPDDTGPLKNLAVRLTYNLKGHVTRVETGELQNWKDETVLPANWGTDFVVQSVTETTYDTLGRAVTERVFGSDGDPISLTQYEYDSQGRLKCTALRMNPAQWDSLPPSACDQPSGEPGPFGPDRITETIYDAAGQMLQVLKAVGTPLEKADVTYTYTLNGQIEHVIDANGNKAKLVYDGFDRQTRWIFPSKTRVANFDANAAPGVVVAAAGALSTDDGMAATDDYEEYTYDKNGNRLTLRKRDGSVITYEYDALNRLTKKDLPNTRPELQGLSAHRRDVYYGYDLRGLPTYARFGSATGVGVSYTYDGFGRLIEESQNSDGNTRSVTSQYDLHGNRTRVEHPDQEFWQFEYDSLDRLVALRQGTWIFGRVDYNNRGLTEQLRWIDGGVGTPHQSRSYGYDTSGRLSSIGFDLLSTTHDVDWSYTRNPASQIISETRNNASYAWDGPANYNQTYTTNGLNQYESAGSAAFCYDANGNLTADGASVYLYDYENRLVQQRAQDPLNTNCNALDYTGTLYANLHYDPTGRLYQINGGTQRFVYDGNAQVVEYDGSDNVLRRYVHGTNIEADDPLIWYEGSAVDWQTRRFLHADPRGSIVAVGKHDGTNIAINSYDEYGIPDSLTQSDPNATIETKGRFRYTGQIWIPELGMYYYKARIYSPTLGRFLQTDPIGYKDQFNLYAYVGNDPINGVDPTGLARICVSEGATRIKNACVRVDGDGDGSSADNDLTSRQKRNFGRAFGKFIRKNAGSDISALGTQVAGSGTDGSTLRVVTQFVGATMGGWPLNVRFMVSNNSNGHGESTYYWHRDKMPGGMTTWKINMTIGNHRNNPSSLARTLFHEFGHYDPNYEQGRILPGKMKPSDPRHQAIDRRAREQLKEHGLDGMGCPPVTSFFGLFQDYPGC